ncbi:MAG: HIT family protein [Fidelibacterota bacterium]|jgi:ATP adenylyltransferase|tara:strand:- start:577 stop:1068 length:492 start_codon:yes stop_codon:yes gene_type:complete
MDKLWAPWRMEYIRSKKDNDSGCVFCNKSDSKNDRDNFVLYRGKSVFIIMNLYPYNNGHIMLCPYEHVETTGSLTAAGMTEIMSLADKSMGIFRKTMKAQGFNFGANIGVSGGAGIPDHIHFHVVPRWIGDTNFMPVISHTKVMIDGLFETYDKLKIEFDKLN